MARFYGQIGYAELKETSPGVWEEIITEHNYYGDTIRNEVRFRDASTINADTLVDNKFSILADEFAYSNFHHIRYIKWMGAKWKIASVDVQRPRLLLTLGGLYNE